MTRAKRETHCPRDPIGLSREQAAAFISVSADTFDVAVADGRMPEPRVLGGRVIWDADEVAEAFRALRRRGQPEIKQATKKWGGVQ